MTGNKKNQAPFNLPRNLTSGTQSPDTIVRDFVGLSIGSSSVQAANPNINQANMEEAGKKKKKKSKQRRDVVKEWGEYIQDETRLENWARFCHDLGLEGDFTSIKKCKKALQPVWINIWDFLDERNGKGMAKRFHSEGALAAYTIMTGKIYPRNKAKEGGPLRALLAHIFRHGGRK